MDNKNATDRHELAGKLAAAMVTIPGGYEHGPYGGACTAQQIAAAAYHLADALIEEGQRLVKTPLQPVGEPETAPEVGRIMRVVEASLTH